MLEGMTPTTWLMVIGLIMQTVVIVVSGTWWLGRALSGLREDIRADRKEIDHNLANVENDLRDRINASENGNRQLVESVSRLLTNDLMSLREKLHNHELHVREEYVRRESFYAVAAEIKNLIVDRIKDLKEDIKLVRES